MFLEPTSCDVPLRLADIHHALVGTKVDPRWLTISGSATWVPDPARSAQDSPDGTLPQLVMSSRRIQMAPWVCGAGGDG